MPLEPSSTYEEWLNQWLIPFTDKCISHCALDGRVMLYLGNTYQTPNMVETVTSQFRAAVIDVYNLPKKRPIQLLDIKPVQLVYVDQLNKSELRQLQDLVSDENVMKWVADGRVWPRAKLDKFIAYSQEESKDRDAATNHWFGIINGLTLSGIVGIHKNINNAWSITIYMNTTKQGQGIGKHAIKLLLEKFNDVKPIYIHTKKTNEPMNKLAVKLGFTPTDAFRDSYNSYKI
jgi:RimJ/RimL family protein N-acetyltransferase